MRRNWKPVIEDAIKHLLDQGLTLYSVDNGDDEEVLVNTINEAVEEIDGVDEAHLYVKNPDGKKRWIFFVMGNEPEEIMSDYICDPLIEKAFDIFCNKWEGVSCPLIKD